MINFLAAANAEGPTEIVRVVGWNVYSWLLDELGIGGTEAGVWLMGGFFLLCMVLPYLVGSINPAIIFSHKVYDDDIRNHGSGNAGATNTLRTYGKRMGFLIFALDLVKAIIAILIGSLLLTRELGGAVAGLFVILGHTFPIYYKFKGGKGVSCLAGVILMLSPISFVILILLFIAIVAITRFVSLGSVMCALLYPLVNNAFYPQNGMITFTGVLIMFFVVFMHRENIKRLLHGNESKLSFSSKKKTEKVQELAEADMGEDKDDSDK